jgi:hypothetical protein
LWRRSGLREFRGTGIKPFTTGQPTPEFDFAEQTLTNKTSFGTSGAGLTGVTQAMVNNPNSILLAAIGGQHITATTTLHVTSTATPVPGERNREYGLPERRRWWPERGRGERKRHVLAGDASGRIGSRPAAVHPDCGAEL